jgi:uncharacterized protein
MGDPGAPIGLDPSFVSAEGPSKLTCVTTPTPDTWRNTLIARIRQEALPPEKFSHQARLYLIARAIADSAGEPLKATHVDDDILFGAAWVHDLGVFIGHRPEDKGLLKNWNSTAYTMQIAPVFLRECGFPDYKIPAVVECIRTHESQGDPNTLEGIIFRDADLLELLGAVGIMRTTAKIAQDTRFITFADAAASLRRTLETVPGHIRLPQAKSMAQPRVAILQAFLEALEAESHGELA